MALSRFVLTTDIPAFAWPGAANLVAAPSVPASNTAHFNASGFPVAVTVSGGTVTGSRSTGLPRARRPAPWWSLRPERSP
jgi:hypothetical protein